MFTRRVLPFPLALAGDQKASPPVHAPIPACKSFFQGIYIPTEIASTRGGDQPLLPTEGIPNLTSYH